MSSSWRQKLQEQDTTSPYKTLLPGQWLFFFIATVGIFITVILWYAFVLQSQAHIKILVELQTEHVANDVKSQFELRISALKHMAKHLEANPQPAYKNWKENIVEFVKDYNGIDGIALYTPDLKQTWLSKENIPEIDRLYGEFIQHYANRILNTITSKQIWVSPGLDMTPDTDVIFVVAPLIGDHNTAKGFLISLINVSTVLNDHINHENFGIKILDSTGKIFQTSPIMASPNSTLASTTIDLYGTPWKIYLQPSKRLFTAFGTKLPPVVLTLGILIALLFAIASQLAQVSRFRARSLVQINLDLKREIAERQAAEKSKQKIERAMLQGQKLQAIGTLAGGIAHDFNNLLYAIMGYVEMAREDVPEKGILHQNLGKVLEASRRGQELISRILTFSRRQQYDAFTPIKLKETIEGVLDLLRPTVPASIEIPFIATIPENFTILGDQTRLHQVIVNLINNAVDAMYGEGIITIKLCLVSKNDEILKEFPETQNHHYCKIDVIDSGQGIDQTLLERIFEPFFTTKEVGKGTGLGLATVHAIIKEHHGHIIVNSELGHGATFTILLPEYQPYNDNPGAQHGKNSAS